MDNIISWIMSAVIFATISIFASCGEILTEKSGHLNLGVPGIMYLSGYVSYYAAYTYSTSTTNPNKFLVVLIAILVALAVGGLLGLLYSTMCVTFKANQNVIGLLIASFGVGFGKFISLITGVNGKATFAGQIFTSGIPFLKDIPYVGQVLFGYGIMTYLAILVAVLMHLFFKKTRCGLNLRAVGESPATADAVGINVTLYKYLGIIIGCALSGVAGMSYVLVFSSGAWSTNNNIEVIGWLAVALVIFVTWKPARLLWGAVLFGLLYWAYVYIPYWINMSNIVGITQILQMFPYLITIIILVMNSIKKSRLNQPPASLGLPYFREER